MTLKRDREVGKLSRDRMPWHETDAVHERLNFLAAWQWHRSTVTELCEQFGISRKTGYKILARYHERGRDGLTDRSRAPTKHPSQTPAEVEAAILRVPKQ